MFAKKEPQAQPGHLDVFVVCSSDILLCNIRAQLNN